MNGNGINVNYGGKQPNTGATVKNFYEGKSGSTLWKIDKTKPYSFSTTTLTPTTIQNIYIPGTIYYGTLSGISDAKVKQDITPINTETTNKIMNLKPTSYTFKSDNKKLIHYGFIAQDVESEFPELIYEKPDKKNEMLKTVNYLEMIPLLVDKIQMMQKEIDELKNSK
jgi:hypothetical protein